MAGGYPRMLSEPVTVYWAGFESDTYRLQCEGWALSADQDVMDGTMQIAMRHKDADMCAITQREPWQYHSDWRDAQRFGNFAPRRLQMQAIHSHIRVHVAGRMDWSRFEPIDAKPTFVMDDPRDIKDLVHFATRDTSKIIVPQETVPDLMKRILEMQEPGRQAHFLKQAKEARLRTTLHAQIYSIAG